MTALPQDRWSNGEAYHRYVGRWSQLVAVEFLRWLDRPVSGRWLDAGCGAGDLTRAILNSESPASVRGIDLSFDYINYAQQRIEDDRASFAVDDAAEFSGEPANTYDTIVSGLVINFLPDPGHAIRSMTRVARPGGTVAGYVWDYAGKIELMRYFWDSAVELFPEAINLDEGVRFPICNPDGLTAIWSAAGLKAIQTCMIDVPTVFENFDDYWSPFLSGQGPAPSFIASLLETDRATLKNLIGSRLPIRTDGSIHLIARAWAVQGTVPR